nr:MAG TPA: hypothetical protein [Caudoviricetes sp.]
MACSSSILDYFSSFCLLYMFTYFVLFIKLELARKVLYIFKGVIPCSINIYIISYLAYW